MQVEAVTSTGTDKGVLFSIGKNEANQETSDAYGVDMLLLGNGTFSGAVVDTNYFEGDNSGLCDSQFYPQLFTETFSPALTPPIAMTLSKTNTLPGADVTLTWKVNNAFSDTAQQCYGYGGLSGKLALSGSVTVPAPATGVYTPAIVCGGTETSLITLYDGVTYLSLSSSLTTIAAGVPVTLTAQITNAGTPAPTGTVTFLSGTLKLGTAKVSSTGLATFTASSTGIAPGTYNVTASYGGDSNYAAATSPAVAIKVIPRAATTITVTPATQQVYVGANVGFTGTVSGSSGYNPTGSISFYDGSALLATATLSPTSGTTTTSSAFLIEPTAGIAPGTYTVTASYPGDVWNAPSTSAGVTVILESTGSVAVTAKPNPVPANTSFTLTATVTGNEGTATGTVVFYAGTTELASTSLNGSGVGTVTIPAGTLASGSYQVTAYYAGDSKNNASTSPAITLVVQ